jgi:hypothetical protein
VTSACDREPVDCRPPLLGATHVIPAQTGARFFAYKAVGNHCGAGARNPGWCVGAGERAPRFGWQTHGIRRGRYAPARVAGRSRPCRCRCGTQPCTC